MHRLAHVILLALYWGTNYLGGLIGVFIVRQLGLVRMTFAAYFLRIVLFLCALVCAQFKLPALIWIFVPFSGLFLWWLSYRKLYHGRRRTYVVSRVKCPH